MSSSDLSDADASADSNVQTTATIKKEADALMARLGVQFGDIDFDLKGYSGKLGRKIELTLADGRKRILILYMELKL